MIGFIKLPEMVGILRGLIVMSLASAADFMQSEMKAAERRNCLQRFIAVVASIDPLASFS